MQSIPLPLRAPTWKLRAERPTAQNPRGEFWTVATRPVEFVLRFVQKPSPFCPPGSSHGPTKQGTPATHSALYSRFCTSERDFHRRAQNSTRCKPTPCGQPHQKTPKQNLLNPEVQTLMHHPHATTPCKTQHLQSFPDPPTSDLSSLPFACFHLPKYL
jgi:hypothetical protein